MSRPLLSLGRGNYAVSHSLLVSVAPFLGEWVQVEKLWLPWSEALLVLTGTLPLCLLQHRLLLCGFVLVTFTDGLGDMLPEPTGQRTNPSGTQSGAAPLISSPDSVPSTSEVRRRLRVFSIWLPSVIGG